MLVLEVRQRGRPPRTASFTRQTLGVGRSLPGLSLGGDLGLAPEVMSPDHLELFERDGLLLYIARGPTLLDGTSTAPSVGASPRRNRKEAWRAKTGRPVRVGSVFEIGDVAIVVVDFVPIVAPDWETSERELLEALASDPTSVAARLAYANTLEERGHLVRAEFLRVQLRLLLDEPLEGDVEVKSRYEKTLLPAWRWVTAVGTPQLARACIPNLGRACPVAWGGAPAPAVCTRCERAVPFEAGREPPVDGEIPAGVDTGRRAGA